MPEFEDAENFPRPCDHLHQVSLGKWQDFLFCNMDPSYALDEITNVMNDRVGFLPIDSFRYAPEYSKDYLVQAHWALYCDNYLEGFHIPFVHNQLNQMLDYGSYTTVLYDHLNLQIGYSDGGAMSFNLPEKHPDYGREVTAFYYWVFPNMMFNFYPWGLSVNIVQPMTKDLTRVRFLTYLYDEELYKTSDAFALTDKVEREDEFVVEAVNRGLKSRFYQSGRFSPKREKGVHHFHLMLKKYLNG